MCSNALPGIYPQWRRNKSFESIVHTNDCNQKQLVIMSSSKQKTIELRVWNI